mgnify:CR=1 FL=1
MLDPTPVSHTIVIIMKYDNFANFPLYSIKTNLPLPTDKIEKPKFTEPIYRYPQTKLNKALPKEKPPARVGG